MLTLPPALRCPALLQEEAGLPVQDRLYRSLKLWSFYVDLEERRVPDRLAPCLALPCHLLERVCVVLAGLLRCWSLPVVFNASTYPPAPHAHTLTDQPPPPPPCCAAWARLGAPRQCTRASWTCASPPHRSCSTTAR